MGKCFVIQPFDKGRYDKRFGDVFAPAIADAGLEAYRVDRDPGVAVPIDEIQSGIESSDACLAEISTDNPNVWFELGYAIALRRDVVLVCSDERKAHFPFDVQHRSIIKYSTESPSDFQELRVQITAKLKGLAAKRDQLGQLVQVTSVSKVEGLEQYEVAGLVAVAQGLDDLSEGLSAYRIRQEMELAGFTKIAGTLGLKALVEKEMLEPYEEQDYNGEVFRAYRLTKYGLDWLHQNRDKLTLKK